MTRFNNSAGETVAGISEGIVPLGQGAMFTAIILGAITVFVIDREFVKAGLFSLVAAGLSFAGFMHAPELALNAAPQYSLGYLIVAGMFVYCAFQEASVKVTKRETVKQSVAS